MRILFITFMLTVVSGVALASGFLPGGVLWTENNRARISIDCDPVYDASGERDATKIECESTSTFFTFDKKPKTFETEWLESDISKMFDEAGKMLAEGKVEYEEGKARMCSPQSLGVIKTFLGRPLKNGEEVADAEGLNKALVRFNQSHPSELSDKRKLFEASLALCSKPPRVAMKEMAQWEHDKATRTCSIFQQTLTEVFEKFNDDLWVHQVGPENSKCKRIKISTLRRPKGGSYADWEFEFKGITLDKQSEGSLLEKCDVGDENLIELYTNRSGPVFIGCDYLQY